jgi:hypothetical protein
MGDALLRGGKSSATDIRRAVVHVPLDQKRCLGPDPDPFRDPGIGSDGCPGHRCNLSLRKA